MDTIEDELVDAIRADLTANEHTLINSALRAAYERGKADVLAAITTEGPNGEVFNAYNGCEDLREFLK